MNIEANKVTSLRGAKQTISRCNWI